MTNEAKIDLALAAQMKTDDSALLPVLIELADQPDVAPAIDRRSGMESLSQQADSVAEGIIARLHELGVRDDSIEWFFIVNAVAVELTPDQIRDIAARTDVKLVRYNGEADVAI